MKRNLVLIILILALPVILIGGCAMPDLNGDITVLLQIPQEFQAFENDVNLTQAIVACSKDGEERKKTIDIIDPTAPIEVLFENLPAGTWEFSVQVKGTIDSGTYTIFSGTESIQISSGISAPATIGVEMEKGVLEVQVKLPAGVDFLSKSAYLLDYEGTAELYKELVGTSWAVAKFESITPKICTLRVELLTSAGLIRYAEIPVKVLPGKPAVAVITEEMLN